MLDNVQQLQLLLQLITYYTSTVTENITHNNKHNYNSVSRIIYTDMPICLLSLMVFGNGNLTFSEIMSHCITGMERSASI